MAEPRNVTFLPVYSMIRDGKHVVELGRRTEESEHYLRNVWRPGPNAPKDIKVIDVVRIEYPLGGYDG